MTAMQLFLQGNKYKHLQFETINKIRGIYPILKYILKLTFKIDIT